jgi:hypothetical protein|tara:strand:- start:352 stop:684 length:333 start_codon:yes stop_codon:yes gene_type:complete
MDIYIIECKNTASWRPEARGLAILPHTAECVKDAIDIAVEHAIDNQNYHDEGDNLHVHPVMMMRGINVSPLKLHKGVCTEWQIDFRTGDRYVIRKSELLESTNERSGNHH